MDETPLHVRWVGDVVIVSFAATAPGEVVPATEGPLGLIEAGARKLVMDLTGSGFISSDRLGKLITVKRRMDAAQGQMRVCCSEAAHLDVLKITRLDHIFQICATLDDAIASLK